MPDDIRALLQHREYEAALERLFDEYGGKVLRMAVAMLRDRGLAEEAVQDVFVKMWRVLPEYDGRAAPSTWLYAIARNTCLSVMRRESYRRMSPLDDVEEPAASPVASSSDLEQCLDNLPDVQRVVITLFYFEERSIREVAALLALPEGTVKSHLHRARRALGDMLGAR